MHPCALENSGPELLLRGRRSCWLLRRGWSGLRLYRLRLQTLEHGSRSCVSGGVNRQRDRCDHECDRRPCGGFGKCTGRTARAEGGLAALSAECGGDIAALAALQQNHDDDEETNQNVDDGNEIDHIVKFFPGVRPL